MVYMLIIMGQDRPTMDEISALARLSFQNITDVLNTMLAAITALSSPVIPLPCSITANASAGVDSPLSIAAAFAGLTEIPLEAKINGPRSYQEWRFNHNGSLS